MPNTNTLTELFEDIADAIRAKDGTSASITATDFPAKIMAIPSGGGGGGINVLFTGDLSNLDFNGLWDSVIADTNNVIRTSNITTLEAAFRDSTLTSIPIVFNFKTSGTLSNPTVKLANAFLRMDNLTSLDLGNQTVYAYGGSGITNAFMTCKKLRTINAPNFKTYGGNAMFMNCHSLRELPFSFETGSQITSSYSPYRQTFKECRTLNKIEGLGVHTGTATQNLFIDTFSACCHISKLTFHTVGTTVDRSYMQNQTIDLSGVIGYANDISVFTSNNSGITADKRVTDATSYNNLKNDPDWFTTDPAYSRYNHDSAVETINSLPDTSVSSGSTGNTIKFLGTAGSATDGGAINTLTAAEIAVATAKGWTVTLV